MTKSKSTSKEKLEQLLAAEGESLLLVAIARGRAGDAAALRLALERLWPVRERSLQLDDFPEIQAISDLPKAAAFIARAVATGRITPPEGNQLVGLLGGARQAYEVAELAQRLSDLETRLGNQ